MEAKCGACGKKHDTIPEYRDCAGVSEEATEAQGVMDAITGETSQVNPPSDRQVTYVADLLAIHDWPDTIAEEDLRAMERPQVSSLITAIKARPKRRQAPAGQSADGRSPRPQLKESLVPAGRYALKAPTEGWVFLQVDKPKDGAWKGNTFVKMLIGSPGSYRQQRLHGMVARNWLSMIEEVTPRQASIDFGIQSGTCGVCSSPLTNAESLKLGIGPVCRGKMGW